MKVTITHKKTQAEVINLVDKSASSLFAGAAGSTVEIADQKKEWDGPVMHFSFTGRMGYISLPLTGTITVGDHDVIVDCELPSLVKNFLGDGKVSASIEKKLRLMLDRA